MLYFLLALCTFVARLPVSPTVSLSTSDSCSAVLFLSAFASYIFTEALLTSVHIINMSPSRPLGVTNIRTWSIKLVSFCSNSNLGPCVLLKFELGSLYLRPSTMYESELACWTKYVRVSIRKT
jgi:hypothetical protein